MMARFLTADSGSRLCQARSQLSFAAALDDHRSLPDTVEVTFAESGLRESIMSLTDKRSIPKATKLDTGRIEALLAEVPGYKLDEAGAKISKDYKFADYYETIAFVNALAYIANQEDHHPDLTVSYNKCSVAFTTHDAGGLTENDFICAARINALMRA